MGCLFEVWASSINLGVLSLSPRRYSHLLSFHIVWSTLISGFEFFEWDDARVVISDWKIIPEKASVFSWYSLSQTSSKRLLQGQKLQTYWFPHQKRFFHFFPDLNIWAISSSHMYIILKYFWISFHTLCSKFCRRICRAVR